MHNYYITPEDYKTAEKNGISKERLNARIRVDGWNKQRAITEPVRKQRDHKEWSKVAIDNGISYDTFIGRVNNGWESEKAATVPKMTRKELGKMRSQRKDNQYDKKYLDLAKKNGISRYMFFRRVQSSGWSVEDAATIKPMTKSEAARSRRIRDGRGKDGSHNQRCNKRLSETF